MKFNTVAAAAALLAGVAYAEDVEESKAVPELPTFTVSLPSLSSLEKDPNVGAWLQLGASFLDDGIS